VVVELFKFFEFSDTDFATGKIYRNPENHWNLRYSHKNFGI